MDKSASSDMLPKRDYDKDLELDKKIEALRRKNAALMKRYQEVEEDRKKAEEEGMALQSRKGKADDLSITISKSTSDSRVVTTKPIISGSDQERAVEGPSQSAGRGQRKQLTVTMPVKKGKRVVIEKSPEPSDRTTEEGQSKHVESTRAKPAHMTKRDTAAQDEVKPGEEHNEEQQRLSEVFQASTDLNIPTSKEEQEEYLRWKKEREQIDRERVARHKNAKGQWRRAWDMDKSDNMFSDKSGDWIPPSRGGRNSRRGQNRTSSDSQGHVRRGKAKEAKNVQVTGSKAKGKDRLTGRARRWESNNDGNLQDSETTLEEFLEELDALTELVDQRKVEDTKTKEPLSHELGTNEQVTVATEMDNNIQKKVDSSVPRGSEKKVRFSDELKQSGASQEPATSESQSPQSMKGSSPKKKKTQLHKAIVDSCIHQERGGESPSAPLTERQENECTTKRVISPPDRSTQAEKANQSVEVGKCNMTSTNTEELIDSGLSVLSMESGEPHQAHSTSSDKAREHGKIV
ncbi:hypothetical protein NQD34_016291 [Periophthalmus magnuspinnatus]|nr:hypothetical protein NQD34_016291 [Periophthalmus magnuspinnatus]